MAKYRLLRGMKDILPADVGKWQLAESRAREVFARFGFREIRTPVMESYDLFARGIGEGTDIIHKEMYVIERGEEKIALRPENTAAVVRAYIEHSLHHGVQGERLYYIGPQFRYERPQKGRQRQFNQIGVEIFGDPGPSVDAEVLGMVMDYLDGLRLPGLQLHLSSVGDAACRPAYREALRSFLEPRLAALCEDCNRRYRDNPLRVFDCKVEADRQALQAAPLLQDNLCDECAEHDAGVRRDLETLGVPFVDAPRLVRGLDYYVRTAFEVTASGLGSQDAVLGGGRYDGLIRDLGGPDVPGFGFAMGLERAILLLPDDHPDLPAPGIDLFLVAIGPAAHAELLPLAGRLRTTGLSVRHEYRPRSLGAQMKRANRLAARLALILGEEERARGACVLKRMDDGSQEEVPLNEAAARARSLLAGMGETG